MITHQQLSTASHTGSQSYASFVDIPTHSFFKRMRTFRDQTAQCMTHFLPDPFPATTSPISRAWQSAFTTKSPLSHNHIIHISPGWCHCTALPTLDLQKEPAYSTECVKSNHRQGSPQTLLPLDLLIHISCFSFPELFSPLMSSSASTYLPQVLCAS